MIFVFGSNLKGIHGAGAAQHAELYCGAKCGQAKGLQGNSYAIPTCSKPGVPLPLEQIKLYVDEFLAFARKNLPPKHCMEFQVTRIGCGFAGYTDEQIAPLFWDAPDNVWLPSAWVRATVDASCGCLTVGPA